MAHIDLKNDEPGIRGLMVYSPDTARALNQLAELLLRSDDNSLSKGEREMIAAYVSYLNDCFFCRMFMVPWPGITFNAVLTK